MTTGRTPLRRAAPALALAAILGLLAWDGRAGHPTDARLLAGGHAYIGARFERAGAFPDRDGAVTSEAQSYAMLRAVWLDDRAGFERAWRWTRANLIGPRPLPAWLWRDGAVVDPGSAADADTDIALALLLAGERWGVPAYADAGARLARAIWQHEVALAGGRYYLAAGPWAVQEERLVVNPSYFAPYAYRLFARADPSSPWLELLDAGYDLAARAAVEPLAGERPAGLPPDWLALRRADGALEPAPLERHDPSGYGFDAPRLYWRLALDLRWSGEPRARALLESATFLGAQVRRAGAPAAVYTRTGAVELGEPSLVAVAGAVAALLAQDEPLARRLYRSHVVAPARARDDLVWWGDGADLYAQEWAWFAVALSAGALPPPGPPPGAG